MSAATDVARQSHPVPSPLPVRHRLPRGTRLVVRPTHGWRSVNLRELWRHRDLIYYLAWRDVKVRYKQTALGVAWALLQPLAAMAVFAVFLGKLAGMPSDGVPYPLFAYAGVLPWTYFAAAVANGSTCLVANTALISKVYFPRLVIPVAAVAPALVDLAVGCGTLVVLLAIYGVTPGASLAWLPLFLLLTVAAALGVAVWTAALDVQFRDVRYAVPFLMQVWLFATPVVYPSSVVPASLRPFYGLNPVAGLIDGWRWALLGRTAPSWGMISVSAAMTAALLVTGLYFFRRTERTFADVI